MSPKHMTSMETNQAECNIASQCLRICNSTVSQIFHPSNISSTPYFSDTSGNEGSYQPVQGSAQTYRETNDLGGSDLELYTPGTSEADGDGLKEI
jgi:hypothetical protein